MTLNKVHQNATELTPTQIQVIGLLSGGASITEAAQQVSIDRATIYRWQQENSAFIAEWNQVRREQLRQIRAELRGLASQAAATLKDLLTDPGTNESVKLKAAVAVLQAVDGLQPEDIGSTDPEKIRKQWEQDRLFEELTSFKP